MQQVLLYLSIASPLVPLITGKKDRSLLWWYALAGFLADVTAHILKTHLHSNPGVVFNTFAVVEFAFISFFYRKYIFSNTYLFYSFLIVMYSGFVISAWGHFDKFNFYWTAFCSVAYMLFIIRSFASILKEKKTVFLEYSMVFWVNVAFLLYSSGNCLVLLFFKYLFSVDRPMMVLIWIYFFLPLNITKNVILGYALSKEKGS